MTGRGLVMAFLCHLFFLVTIILVKFKVGNPVRKVLRIKLL